MSVFVCVNMKCIYIYISTLNQFNTPPSQPLNLPSISQPGEEIFGRKTFGEYNAQEIATAASFVMFGHYKDIIPCELVAFAQVNILFFFSGGNGKKIMNNYD